MEGRCGLKLSEVERKAGVAADSQYCRISGIGDATYDGEHESIAFHVGVILSSVFSIY